MPPIILLKGNQILPLVWNSGNGKTQRPKPWNSCRLRICFYPTRRNLDSTATASITLLRSIDPLTNKGNKWSKKISESVEHNDYYKK